MNERSTQQLTPRERQVIELARHIDRDIALILGCSKKTVSAHWEHIRAKMGVETKTAAALDWLDQSKMA